MRKFRVYTIFMLLFIICSFAAMYSYIYFTPLISQDADVIFYLKPGTSKSHLLTELTQEKLIKHPVLFSIYIYTHPNDHLKTGEYLFPKGATLVSIWRQITAGTGLYYRTFTIIPGWSFNQLRKELAQTDTLNHYTNKLTDKQIMAHLGKPNLSPEGEFYPETYYYTRGNVDLVILKRAFDLMQLNLLEAWESRAAALPYHDSYAALIVASLVEKEAYLATERPVIAGVIINRLQKNMLLQIDPTVIYGMGERYTGKIYKDNLREDTPYNTYVHKGLPPTPIAMPSKESIQAAMHPDIHDYYYFVAKGDGSHQFSKSLPEHHQAVKAALVKPSQSWLNGTSGQKYLDKILKQSIDPVV